ncbi:YbaB/EbfC family nucleoid-associated protein [soil metagenome]
MFDLINKFGDIKKKMDEIKSRLDLISVEGEAGAVKVTVTANRKVKSISIDESLLNPNCKEELQELLETALNRALTNAEQVSETEMKAAGKDFLPGFPGF